MFDKSVSPHYARELSKFSAALEMKKLLCEAEQSVSVRSQRAFLATSIEAIDGYLRELRHRLRLVDGYEDDFDRLLKLKTTIRGAEPLFHVLQREDDIPPVAKLFFQSLGAMVTDMTSTIFFIEQRYPEHREEFEYDRQEYAKLSNQL